MINYLLADLLVRIRNGYRASLDYVCTPFSNMNEKIIKILQKNKYVASYEKIDLGHNKWELKILLRKISLQSPMPELKLLSKPGHRKYVKAKDIQKSFNGEGIFIISTSKWVMTGYEAHAQGIGGELLCEVF